MADATAAPPSESRYDVKIENVSGACKRISVTVPADVIAEKIEESMGTLATQTTLPGFRKGRAPKALLERRFGTTLRQETKNQLIADAYASAVEDHKIQSVGEPQPVTPFDEIDLVEGKPLSFTVEVEVVPEFDLPKLDGLEIRKPVIDVADEHIDRELNRQCTQFGEIQDVKDGFQEGDRLLGPGSAQLAGDDEPFFTHDDVDVIYPPGDGKGHVLGLLIDDLGQQLKGKKLGESITIKTTGPESHELEHVRGKEITISIQLRDAQRIIPAEPQQVVDAYGLGSVDVLREQIRLSLEQRRDEEQRSAMREQVYAQLTDLVDFELPEKMSQNQASRLVERQRLEMLYRGGLSADEVERRLAELRGETEAESRRRLKLSFLLHRLAEHFEVKVTEQEINGRIAAIANTRGIRPEKLRAELIQSGQVNQIAMQLREHKAADRVIDQAKVVDVSADDWNAEIEKRAGGSKKTTSKKTTTKKKTTKKKT